MAQAITDFTGIDTTITVVYSEGYGDVPGRFLFGIEFSKTLVPLDVSFASSLALGDVADISVTNSNLMVEGRLSVSNEFGVIFAPDDTEEMKLTAGLSGPVDDDDGLTSTCPSSDANIDFSIRWRNTTMCLDSVRDICTTNVTVTCSGGTTADDRVTNMRSALYSTNLRDDVTASLVGTSTLVLSFIPTFSYAEIYIETEYEDNIFGLNNETMKKSQFQFANGQAQFAVDVGVSGNAEVAANVGGVVEISADIEAELSGSLLLKAGNAGELIPMGDWVSKVINLTAPENARFAEASASFDGSFSITGSVNEPFEMTMPSTRGEFREPYQLNLLALITSGSASIPEPDIRLDIPSIGDLGNLTFKDVINLLQQFLGFLIGEEEGDSVDTCSGGLLGKEIDGTPGIYFLCALCCVKVFFANKSFSHLCF